MMDAAYSTDLFELFADIFTRPFSPVRSGCVVPMTKPRRHNASGAFHCHRYWAYCCRQNSARPRRSSRSIGTRKVTVTTPG